MIRILLADDHKQVRKALRATLEECGGWQVCAEASNGHEAVQFALQTRPDIAILDLAMPEMNGIEATRQIKQALPQVDVLIFTMYDSQEMNLAAREAGAQGLVRKSGNESEIIEAIRALLREKPASRSSSA
jgi:DNA-binding NarL/FixJ family response regulator